LCLSSSSDHHFLPTILFLSTALSTRITDISLHAHWPLTSQLHGSLLKENNCFSLRIIPYPTRRFPTQFWHWCMEWNNVWFSTKPLLIEEIWPGRGLNTGLQNDTPVLYQLLHKHMLPKLSLHKAKFLKPS
jgi:hypothetical protein